jgi:hypothetical protein
MAFDQKSVQAAVRALIPNIPNTVLPNSKLDVYIEQAVRRLSVDRPREVVGTFAGDGGNYYVLSTSLTGWIDGQSRIISVAKPAPTIADDDIIEWTDSTTWETYDDGTDEYIRFKSSPSSSQSVVIKFTTSYTLNGTDGETVTTVPAKYENGVEQLTASIACYALGSQAAGTTDSEIPGDIINYRSKQREYLMMGREWEAKYLISVGLQTPDGVSLVGAAISRATYPQQTSIGTSRMTH